jgi:hypothetical protein
MLELLRGRYDELVAGVLLGLAATACCLVAWRWCRRARPGAATPVVGLALAAAGGIGLAVTGGAPSAPVRPWPLLGMAVALAGALVASFDRRWRERGLTPGLLAVTAAGIYACVPDVEGALVVLGVALPMALLGWPWPLVHARPAGAGNADADEPVSAPPPSLGVAGSVATAALLVWTVATGGAGRPGSVIGGLACLGLLIVEPLARLLTPDHRSPLARLDRRWVPWSALGAQLLLVAIASRVVGRAETVTQALPLAAVALAVALAVAIAWGRRSSAQRTAA